MGKLFTQTSKGVFKPAQKDAYVNFALSLNDSQKKQFSDLIKGIDLSLAGMFSEMGHSEGESASLSEDNQIKAIKKLANEKNISYIEASKLYREMN